MGFPFHRESVLRAVGWSVELPVGPVFGEQVIMLTRNMRQRIDGVDYANRRTGNTHFILAAGSESENEPFRIFVPTEFSVREARDKARRQPSPSSFRVRFESEFDCTVPERGERPRQSISIRLSAETMRVLDCSVYGPCIQPRRGEFELTFGGA